MWKSLKEFSHWYWENGTLRPKLDVPEKPIKISELGLCEFVLFRNGQYQVELITLFAGREIPPHSHPNVDSVDVHLTGTGESWIGNHLMPQADLERHPLDNRIPIPAKVEHHGFALTDVAVISLQKWKNKVPPSFITDDWEDKS